MLSIFKPAPHIQRLPADKVDPVYRKLRWQIFWLRSVLSSPKELCVSDAISC